MCGLLLTSALPLPWSAPRSGRTHAASEGSLARGGKEAPTSASWKPPNPTVPGKRCGLREGGRTLLLWFPLAVPALTRLRIRRLIACEWKVARPSGWPARGPGSCQDHAVSLPTWPFSETGPSQVAAIVLDITSDTTAPGGRRGDPQRAPPTALHADLRRRLCPTLGWP